MGCRHRKYRGLESNQCKSCRKVVGWSQSWFVSRSGDVQLLLHFSTGLIRVTRHSTMSQDRASFCVELGRRSEPECGIVTCDTFSTTNCAPWLLTGNTMAKHVMGRLEKNCRSWNFQDSLGFKAMSSAYLWAPPDSTIVKLYLVCALNGNSVVHRSYYK